MDSTTYKEITTMDFAEQLSLNFDMPRLPDQPLHEPVQPSELGPLVTAEPLVAPPLTLADALLAIDSAANLTPTKRGDLRSAVKRAGEIIGRDIHAIPCDPPELSRLLYADPARASGLRPSGHANLLSRIRHVLRLVGTHAPRRKGSEPLPHPWSVIVASAPGAPQRAALARFASWAIAQNLSPNQVHANTMVAYETHRRATELTTPRQGIARTLCKLWRAAVDSGVVPGGQPTRLPGRGGTYVLEDEAFPASLIAEREAWLAAASSRRIGRSLIDPSAPRRPISDATVDIRRFAFRQAASVLVQLGHPAESLKEMRDLVVPVGRVAEVVCWFEQRREHAASQSIDSTRNPYDAQLAIITQTLIVVAKQAREVPAETINGLGRLIGDLQAERGQALTPKNEARLRAMIQPQPYAMLINLPAELMEQARARLAVNKLAAARIAMHAVALEVLLMCPLRRKNLSALRVDEHLMRLDPTRQVKITHLAVPAAQTKGRRRIEWPVPEPISRLMEDYVRNFRPHLAKAENAFLFPGRGGIGHFEESSLGMAISKDVARNVGVKINLHLLRHFAAWLYLRKHPGRMDDVRRILGHHSIATTERFYVAFQDVAAAERFDEVVLGERRRTAATAAAAWRPPITVLRQRQRRVA